MLNERANAVLFLASNEASYITGHTLQVDGGRTGRMKKNCHARTFHDAPAHVRWRRTSCLRKLVHTMRPNSVSLAKGEQQGDTYLRVNRRGKVLALRTEAGMLTENVAILTYLARLFPGAKLLPDEPFPMTRCLSHMAYLSNTVHPAFMHIVRPGRFATDEAAHENVRTTGREKAWTLLQELDALFAGKSWVLGDQYSVADRYTLVIYGWGRTIGCRLSSSLIILPSRTACCSARQFGQCSSARRASCSRADQIWTLA